MTEKELELQEKNAEMEGDMKAVIASFYEVVSSLGINMDDFKKEDESLTDERHALNIQSKMPSIMSSLTMAVMGGGFNGATLSKLTALTPIFNKYKHLAEDIIKK